VHAQILAPLAVARDLQAQAIGTRLVKGALQQIDATSVELIFVLGYPDYYSRFEFAPAGVRGFQAPYPIALKNADARMVCELKLGAIAANEGTIKCCDALDHQQYLVE
jgi:predicted N-acetyltransferase YhbS